MTRRHGVKVLNGAKAQKDSGRQLAKGSGLRTQRSRQRKPVQHASTGVCWPANALPRKSFAPMQPQTGACRRVAEQELLTRCPDSRGFRAHPASLLGPEHGGEKCCQAV